MPTGVPIQAIPNQSFSITLDNQLFAISIKETNGCVAVSIDVNGVNVIENLRTVSGSPIIPAKYQEAGNFMFVTANQQVPDYLRFNVTQTLQYFTAAELTAFRAPVPPPIMAAFFDPLGGLPLRFAPRGYTSG